MKETPELKTMRELDLIEYDTIRARGLMREAVMDSDDAGASKHDKSQCLKCLRNTSRLLSTLITRLEAEVK